MGLFDTIIDGINTIAKVVVGVTDYISNDDTTIAGPSLHVPLINGVPNYRQGGVTGSHLDGDVTDSEANSVQSLTSGVSRDQAVKAILANKALKEAVLLNSMVNIKPQSLQLSLTSTYAFSHLPGNELHQDPTLRDDIVYIGVDEHAYNHIVPNLFNNWEKLLQWQFFYVNSIQVKISINSPDTTSTQVVYFPMGMDTIDMDNETVLTAYNKSGQVKGEGLEYLITNFSPMKYILEENGHISLDDYILRPTLY